MTQSRVDLLFETAGTRELILLELQSQNDATLPVRMAEYALQVWRKYKRFPRMYVLYIGRQRLRMPAELDTPYVTCSYSVVDIRNFEAETLLQSNHPADAVLAILGRNGDRPDTVRRILERVAKLKGSSRKIAFTKLMILAGVRHLAAVVEQEARQMPIHYDIMDHEVIGPAIRKGLIQGKAQGRAEGKIEGAAALAERLLTTRFGPLSPKTKKSLAKLTLPELEDLAVKILTAKSIPELFPR